MSSPRITFTRHPDATPEAKREALANIYRFVLDCLAEKVGGPAITAPTTPKGDQATASPLLYLNDPEFLLVVFDLSIPGVAVSRVIRDRLALLLIAQAREGWEREFEEIMGREIEWLAPAATEAERERDE